MQKLNVDKEFKDLIPPLSKDEYDALEQSILSEGCRDAIVTWQGTIIDGHNRYKICEKHDIPFVAKGMDFNSKEEAMLWMIENQLGRRNLLEPDRVKLAMKQGEIYTAMGLERKAEGGRKSKPNSKVELPESFQMDEEESFEDIYKTLEEDEKPVNTRAEVAKMAGVSEFKISQYKQLQDELAGEEERIEEIHNDIREGKTTINKALKDVKAEKKQAELQAKIEEQIAEPHESESIDIFNTDNKYRVIYADPPWSYDDKKKGYGGADDIYPTMSLEDICELPVGEIAEKDSVLWMWATPPMLTEAFEVLNAWGFKYKQHFVWDKVKPNLGHYHSCNHELLLIATKGNCAPDTKEKDDSVQVIEKTKHSAKPKKFIEIIDSLYPVGARIELFARESAEGWDCFGNMV